MHHLCLWRKHVFHSANKTEKRDGIDDILIKTNYSLQLWDERQDNADSVKRHELLSSLSHVDIRLTYFATWLGASAPGDQ
jgi:hypothetical protein